MPLFHFSGRGALTVLALLGLGRLPAAPVVEALSRGLVAVHQPDGKVFVSWRLLASDPEGTGFNLYRTTAPGPARPGMPEQAVSTRDKKELHIYTSTIPTRHRLVTFMHDPQYRVAVAGQNPAYNQPPHPGFYLDESAPLPPRPVVEFAPSTK